MYVLTGEEIIVYDVQNPIKWTKKYEINKIDSV